MHSAAYAMARYMYTVCPSVHHKAVFSTIEMAELIVTQPSLRRVIGTPVF